MIALFLWALFLAVWGISMASAHSPEDTDPAFAPWFSSLKYESGRGWEGSCCNDRDCHVFEAAGVRIVPADAAAPSPALREDHYEVRDPEGQAWLPVPSQKILKRYDNPTGKVVACIEGHQVLCFVKAAGL